jgi:hypothetical protein
MPYPHHDKNQTTPKHSHATEKSDLIEAARELSQHSDATRKKKIARMQMQLIAAVLMGIIAFIIGREFLYSVLGTTIDAKVTRQSNAQRSAGRNGGTYSVVVVDYSFAETSCRQRQERDEIRFGSDIAVSDTVSVEYIPRIAGFSRVRGNSNHVIAILTACTIPLLIVFGVLWRTDQPRFGAIMIWGGVFLVATIDAVVMSILPLRDHSIQHDWLGILTIFVCLVFAAMGYLGMWFSGRGLWRAMMKGPLNGD